jgi:predicted DNA-binding WGR domain protein
MELIKRTTLHYQAGTSDKLYEIDLCRLSDDRYLVNFRYGRRGKTLKDGTKTKQAMPLAEADRLYSKLISSKLAEGYQRVTDLSGSTSATPQIPENPQHQAVLDRLVNRNALNWPLERAIWRAGELQIRSATPFLLELLGTGTPLRDYCIAWALGWCGDASTVAHLQDLYEDKTQTEFVRRIAWDAAYKLADAQTQTQMRSDKMTELPADLQTAVRNGDPDAFAATFTTYLQTPIYPEIEQFQAWLKNLSWWDWSHRSEEVKSQILDTIATFPESVRSQLLSQISQLFSPRNPYDRYYNTLYEPGQEFLHAAESRHFGVLTTLYQIDTPAIRPALLQHLRTTPLNHPAFQSFRHLFKLAEYRRDWEVYSICAYRFDTSSPKKYANAYNQPTRNYMRRRVWRLLSEWGTANDRAYIDCATAILLQFADADSGSASVTVRYRWMSNPWRRLEYRHDWDVFASCFTFSHILYQHSPRYELLPNGKAWRCRDGYKPGDPPPSDREEAFPALWEQHPEALLQLVTESRCHRVHQFAAKALHDCPQFCAAIPLETLLHLLHQPYEETVELGFEWARSHYNPDRPDLELIQALVSCPSAIARTQAREWIAANPPAFLDDTHLLATLVTSVYADNRTFALRFLQVPILAAETAHVLIGRIIAQLLVLEVEQAEIAIDIGIALLSVFASQLRAIGLSVIRDLLDRPLPEVQSIGVRLLLNHNTPAAELPPDLIESLIDSPYEAVRSLGIQLFDRLPDDRLLLAYDLLLAMATAKLPDLRSAVRPILARLATNHPEFASQLAAEAIELLFVAEKYEGVHADLVELLRQDLPGWMSGIDRNMAMRLLRAKSPVTQELGGLTLAENYALWATQFTTPELVQLANSDILAVREAARTSIGHMFDLIRGDRQELLSAVRLLEAKWEDSRDFARHLFSAFHPEEWTPDLLVCICDSTREEVRRFGRDLAIGHFQPEYGSEYLLKFSEHPSADMQEFVTNYLENYARDNCDRLRQLTPYFMTVLSQVNRARTAKDRVFAFLNTEAQKSMEAAQIVAEILTRQSLTVAIGDRSKMIQMMVKLKQKFPDVALPITINSSYPR